MKIQQMYIPKSPNKRPMLTKRQKGIVIHSTANTAPAINEAKNLARPGNKKYASFNTVIDDKEIIEVIPHNEITYNAANREGNWHYIAIEMTEGGNRDKVIQNTVKYTAMLLKKYGWNTSHLRRHYDFPRSDTGWKKPCPQILMYNNWQGWIEFKTLVEIELQGGLSNMTEKEVREIVYDIIEPSRNGGSPNAHWAYKHFTNLNELGANLQERRFDDMMTRGEVFAFVDKLLTSINLTDK